MTKLQLAQKRNYFKFVLSGMFRRIDLEALTPYEKDLWNKILNIRKELIEQFEYSSKFKGLKVPEHRCWCGKEGKYDPEFEIQDYMQFIKVCKKHIKNLITKIKIND